MWVRVPVTSNTGNQTLNFENRCYVRSELLLLDRECFPIYKWRQKRNEVVTSKELLIDNQRGAVKGQLLQPTHNRFSKSTFYHGRCPEATIIHLSYQQVRPNNRSLSSADNRRNVGSAGLWIHLSRHNSMELFISR